MWRAVVRAADIIERTSEKQTTKSEGGMNDESKPAGGKKPYQPPQVTAISLRPEEAVLGACKISGGSGPASSSCQPIGTCPTQGS
jgi:hypothetical protein